MHLGSAAALAVLWATANSGTPVAAAAALAGVAAAMLHGSAVSVTAFRQASRF
ncbi:hypothetical protein [Streptomyces smyrnaeus]|uniref:hypothetical protein n=1 Tax=Streptomyces smyrnaeus TaxID=1387713 RepID=UPI0036C8E69B